jgi:hypothetical protein
MPRLETSTLLDIAHGLQEAVKFVRKKEGAEQVIYVAPALEEEHILIDYEMNTDGIKGPVKDAGIIGQGIFPVSVIIYGSSAILGGGEEKEREITGKEVEKIGERKQLQVDAIAFPY